MALLAVWGVSKTIITSNVLLEERVSAPTDHYYSMQIPKVMKLDFAFLYRGKW